MHPGEALRVLALAIILAGCAGCRGRGAPETDHRLTAQSTAAAASPSPRFPVHALSVEEKFVPVRITGEGKAMGTHLAYAAFTTPTVGPERVRALFEEATAEIVRLERLMTTWDPQSEVSLVNAAAGQAPVAVSPETFDVIRESLRASEMSEGTFDITFETLHGLWKFDQDLDPHPPSAAQVAERVRYLGYRHVKLDPGAHTVFLDEPHVRIGLGGIAKGFAVDRAASILERGGVTSFYVQAGGDLFARGSKPDGAPWNAGIRDPRGPEGDYFATMPVIDHAFSTAGDYERTYIVGGKRYHHIIDPRTGYPAAASRSVTIWAPTAFLADEIDDAVFILGPEKGLALVESLEDVGAVIVDAQNKVWTSKRLAGKVESVHAPTNGL